VELDRNLVPGLDDPIEPGSSDQLFGGGKPLLLTALVGKLGEKNSGFFDDGTS